MHLADALEAAQAGATLSPEAVAGFCASNAEAAERCQELSPAGALPGNVRSLFHSSTPQRASLGCLLEQAMPHTHPVPHPCIGHIHPLLQRASLGCLLEQAIPHPHHVNL